MADRKYYVLCENNCKFEGMTKEQILTAITQAVENGSVENVDAGFVTTIKEQNSGVGLSFWVGTMAEYNAIDTKKENCFYVITDDTTGADMKKDIAALKEAVADIPQIMPLSAEIVVTLRDGSATCKDANGKAVKGVQNGNVFTFVPSHYGTYTITGTWGNFTEEKTVEVTAVKQHFETINYYSEVFAENDWETIIKVAQNGIQPEGWATGDRKSFDYEMDVVILGKNCDTYSNGNKAPFTFMFDLTGSSSLIEKYENVLNVIMTAPNGGDWTKSNVYTTNLPAFLDLLPDYFSAAMQTVKKRAWANDTEEVTETSVKTFILSSNEVFGTSDEPYSQEGEQYEYFANGNILSANRTKWTRSIGANYFYCITQNNVLAQSDGKYKYYLYPAFCF